MSATKSKILYAKDDEWYTPAEYIEAARDAMGGIHVDPASCAFAQKTVKANVHWTKEQDGLQQRWNVEPYGSERSAVWLNPPYSRIAEWTTSLVRRYSNREFEQACLLVNASTEARWFQPLFDYPICFIGSNAIARSGRIRFVKQGGATKRSPVSGNAMVYLGPYRGHFFAALCTYGRVVVPLQNDI